MNYNTRVPIFAGILFSLVAITPNAYAAILIDDFTDGASSISQGINCIDSNELASVLGGTRNMFVCRDSGAGTATAETDTIAEQFIFTLNAAAGSSGLNYDDAGALLNMVDLTQGGANNVLLLNFIKADKQTSVTVEVADSSGGIGTFQFDFGPTVIAETKYILFSMIDDPLTSVVPDFTKIEHVGVFFEGSEPSAQDTELILGSISADFLQVNEADLSISKSENSDPITAGNALTYTIQVTNNGPATATNVVVLETLPAGVTFVSTTGCAEDPNGVPSCSIGDMPAGSSILYTVMVTVNPGATGILSNAVQVSSTTPDPNSVNNFVTEITTVDQPNDDIDNDGVPNNDDNCPLDANTLQTDTDSDGFGDVCDIEPANSCLPDPNALSCNANGQVIGGKIIQIEATSLILAGAQSTSWMIPVVLSVLGIGMYVVSRKSENS